MKIQFTFNYLDIQKVQLTIHNSPQYYTIKIQKIISSLIQKWEVAYFGLYYLNSVNASMDSFGGVFQNNKKQQANQRLVYIILYYQAQYLTSFQYQICKKQRQKINVQDSDYIFVNNYWSKPNNLNGDILINYQLRLLISSHMHIQLELSIQYKMTTLTKQESSGLSAKIKARETGQQLADINEQKYTFSIDVTIQDKIEVPKTEIIIPNHMKISEAARIALQKFKLELELLQISVNQDIENYKPRLAKKNGKAKTDMPCLDYEQILAEVKVKAVCLDPKTETTICPILPNRSQKKQLIRQKQGIQNQIQIQTVSKQAKVVSKAQKQIVATKQQQSCFCIIF